MVNEEHKSRDAGGSPAPVAIEGKCLAAGGRSRRFFGHLLGLPRSGGKYHVRAAAWMDHAVEVAIPTGDRQEAVFRIERSTEQSVGLIRTGELVLYFRGQDIPVDLAELIETHAPEQLARHTIESLAEQLMADPELGDPAQPMPESTEQENRPVSLLDTWGTDDAWADFFAGGELARAQLDSLDPSSLFTFIQHSDAECLHVNPHTGGSVVWLINHPWDNRIRHGQAIGDRLDLTTAASEGMITSDLDENDVIMGNPGKLQRLLKRAEQIHQLTGKPLFFSNTCTPVVTGEDVESTVKRFARRSGCPLLYLTVTPRSMVNVFHDVLVTRRLQAEQHRQERPGTINLVGFRSDPESEELRGLLNKLSIEVNCIVIPDLDFELVEHMPAAEVNVFYPNKLWQHLYDQVQFSSRVRPLQPPAPFGIDGTLQWLEQIGRALGREEFDLRPVREQAEQARQQLQQLAQDIDQCCLGLVLRADETHFLADPGNTWGVPLIGMIEEMGFGLDIFLKVSGREQAARAARQVHTCLRRPERHVIKAFDSMTGMLERIENSRAQAFFSAHFFDWRITGSGKNLFSLQHFEMGLRGVVRTARRLLGICRTPYYQQLHQHLRRSRAGLWPAGQLEGAAK
ncbi:MAG: hypothetical protein DRI34_01335 [Deltaproteobacteria bacterium]|nr:MAG: hypothetical protein DRI34_01335 [Deltaproteobacteria bacterium]